MKNYYFLCVLLLVMACKKTEDSSTTTASETTETVTDENDISDISTKDFREFKVLDSKYISKESIWAEINADLSDFTEDDYNEFAPLVLDQDIPTLHAHILKGKLSYEILTKFYLYRIRKYDRENDLSLNSVISVNPNAIMEARAKDDMFKDMEVSEQIVNTVFGMPILLKDNINTLDMPTTAGAVAFKDNQTEKDAYIVSQLKANHAIILGKANLSEWAYFFCGDCPSGYSAIGGQTLNPYGRRIIDTGGSSSGSGVAVAANFCAAAIGSETSGSILSPASQNSTVGLKPTIGLVSRTGIVPISSTLDTAGPITRTVIDNAIVLDALFGEDKADAKSFMILWQQPFYTMNLDKATLEGKRFGMFNNLKSDTLYMNAVEVLKAQGAEIVELDPLQVDLPKFIRLLNLDMKPDLASYLKDYSNPELGLKSIEDIMAFNQTDSSGIMPYGQRLFRGVSNDSSTAEEFEEIKAVLKANGKRFFDEPMESLKLDGFLSINNYHAGYAAVAEYPALTVPMGYSENGAPKGLTFISSRLREKQLLEWAYVYEQASNMRVSPKNYD